MKRFKNILVYFDTNSKIPQTALDSAIELARVSGARITVMDVLKEHSWQATPAINTWKDVASILRSEMRNKLDAVVQIGRKKDVDISAAVSQGLPFVEIIREVLRNDHDIVYKTVMGEGTRTGRVFGNTAIHLMRKCPCPVMLVKPGDTKEIRRVVAAINPFPEEIQDNALSKKIVELALSLATSSGSALSVVHAWKAQQADLLEGRLHRDLLDKYIMEVKRKEAKALDEFIKQFENEIRPEQIHLIEGDPPEVLRSFVSRENGDMLVLGTVGTTGIRGLIVGNTCETLLEHADCSVLGVKPDGFVSPVVV